MGSIIKYATALALMAAVAFPATYYVSTTGNDTTGDGSIGNPWRNIRKGVISMAGGDTLYIRQGTYDSDGFRLSEFDTGISSSQPTIISAYPGESVTYLDTTDRLNMVMIGSGKSNIVVSGIVFDGAVQSSAVFKIDGGSQAITLTNVTVKNGHDAQGLLISPVAGGNELGLHVITRSSFITNGWSPIEGDSPLHQIYVQNSSNVIEYCYIEGVDNSLGGGYGIHDYSSDGYGNIWRNNYITNCNAAIGVVGSRQRDTQIYNNVMVGSLGFAIDIRSASNIFVLNNSGFTNAGGIFVQNSTNIVVENNIMVGSSAASSGGVWLSGCDTVEVRNNLAYDSFVNNNRVFDYKVDSSTGVTAENNLFTNPSPGPPGIEFMAMFYNPLAGILSLTAGSDAIDTGVAQSLFSDDYTGVQRPRGTAWDIGAYEFDQAPPKKPRRNGPGRFRGM